MNCIARELIREMAAPAAALRRELHGLPELAGVEFATSARLRKALCALPVEVCPPFLATDVVGFLHGRAPGRNVTLRADIDALPFEDGPRHACGHDGHAAMLWGAIAVLARLRDRFRGSVRFVFQPGEEIKAMAADLIAAGALRDPVPDGVFALHGWPGLPVGVVGSRAGVLMAAGGFFSFRLNGRGGHGANPEAVLNPLYAAAGLCRELAAIPQSLSAREKTVVAVCRVAGGTNANRVPDTALVEGTIRFLDGEDGRQLAEALEGAAKRIEAEYGVGVVLDYATPYPALRCDAAALAMAREGLAAIRPDIEFREIAKPFMSSEDFSYFLRQAPGAYLRIGLGENRPIGHAPDFEFNDEAIPVGMAALVGAALRRLDALSGSLKNDLGPGT